MNSAPHSSRAAQPAWLIALLKELVPANLLAPALADINEHPWTAAVRAGLTTDAAVLDRLARRTRLPIAAEFAPTPTLASAVPEGLARRLHVVTVAVTPDVIEVATSDPYDIEGEQYLGFTTERRVRLSLAAPHVITEQLDLLYEQSPNEIERLLATLAANDPIEAPATPDDALGSVQAAVNERPIIQLVDHILTEAVSSRASDVHLEIEEAGVMVRHRVDGVLQHALTLPKSIGLPIISRFKVMARMDIADRVRPQGGHARITVNNAPIDVRMSTLPASLGEKLVVRLLDPSATLHTIEALGFDHLSAQRINILLDTREGLILITGPTGSGKTTTLYAALRLLVQRGLNIVTVEDPVEYRIPGIVQVQVNPKAGLTFADALRSILRQDPDVILIGEVRDHETAAIAIQAALTGHLVFATLHTIDAMASIARLNDLGVTPPKVGAAVKGIIAQRLLRRVCPAPHTDGNACDLCGGSRYKGRVAAAEIVVMTAELQQEISSGATVSAIRLMARREGVQSMWRSATGLAHSGVTTMDEVRRVLDPEYEVTPEESALPVDVSPPGPPVRPPPRGIPCPDDDEGAGDRDDGAECEQRGTSSSPSTVRQMTQIVASAVDVYIIDSSEHPWRVLALQRAEGTRSPGSWEAVHGKIDEGETPAQAALREVDEETGLSIGKLYAVTVQPFYLHKTDVLQMAIVFCAFVDSGRRVVLSDEHRAAEWLSMNEAAARYIWPRAELALHAIKKLLATGDAGAGEDVVRVI